MTIKTHLQRPPRLTSDHQAACACPGQSGRIWLGRWSAWQRHRVGVSCPSAVFIAAVGMTIVRAGPKVPSFLCQNGSLPVAGMERCPTCKVIKKGKCRVTKCRSALAAHAQGSSPRRSSSHADCFALGCAACLAPPPEVYCSWDHVAVLVC